MTVTDIRDGKKTKITVPSGCKHNPPPSTARGRRRVEARKKGK